MNIHGPLPSIRRARTGSLSKRHRISASLALAISLALVMMMSLGAVTAQSAGPALRASITTLDTTVLSGGRAAYDVRAECSNLDPVGCRNIQLTLTAPVSTDGTVRASDPSVDSTYVTGSSYSATAHEWTLELVDLTPGESIQFSTSWIIPNFITPDGTTFEMDGTVSFAGANGSAETTPLDAPDSVQSSADPKVSATKTLISPASANLLQPGDNATYRITACTPNNALGQIGLSSVEIVDTFDDWSGPNPGDEVTVVDADGGTVNQSAHTVTWDIDVTGDPVPLCGTSDVITREITLHYPVGMRPNAAPGSTEHYPFKNIADITALATNGSSAAAHAEVNHSFTHFNQPPGLLILAFKNAGEDLTIARGDTSTEYRWFTSVGYSRGAFEDVTERRMASIIDRFPCVGYPNASSTQSFPAGGPGLRSRLYAQNGDLTSWDGDAPGLCTTPGFRTTRIELTGDNAADVQRSTDRIAYVSAKYYDAASSTHGAAKWDAPVGGITDPNISMYGAGSQSLNIPSTATVTDVVITFRNVPLTNNNGGGQKAHLWGTSTQDFADSNQYSMANTEGTAVSTVLNADGSVPFDPSDSPANSGVDGWNSSGAGKTFVDQYTDLSISKEAVDDVTAVRPGDTPSWRITAGLGTLNSTQGIAPRVVDILPVGLEYEPGSVLWTLNGHAAPTELIETFTDGNGYQRQRIIWQFAADFTAGQTVQGVFTTTVTLDAAEGSHATQDTAQVAAIYDADRDRTEGSGQPDVYDIDGDGNTTELVVLDTVDWTVVAQAGARVQKFVRGSAGDGEWKREDVSIAALADDTTPETSGTDVDYRIEVTNPGNQRIRNVVVYDVLPHIGDTAIGSDLRGDPRGSHFQVDFAGLLPPLAPGTAIEYSSSDNPCRPELFPAGDQGTCVNDWTSVVPSDPKTVRALRVTIQSISAGGVADLTYRGTVPVFDFDAGSDQVCIQSQNDPQIKAWNNVAFQADRVRADGSTQHLLPAEAPKVSIRAVCGRIGDFVWLDKNRDGLQDSNEDPVPGAVIQLLNANGDPVLDTSGLPITTTTDANGRYYFNVPVGDWAVQVVSVPDGFLFTKVNVGNDPAIDSDAPGLNIPTASVSITPENLENLTLDFGLWRPGPTIDIEKEDSDGNDADTAAEAVVLPDGKADLVFTVTNHGNEPLVDVAVSDKITAGSGTVSGLVCTFPDGSRGTKWAGPFAVNASFTCSALLADVTAGTSHTDRATVTGLGEFSGLPVSDHDDYNGTNPQPEIDIEKLDTDGNDADTRAEAVTVDTPDVGLRFIVTNTGNEDLTEVKVSDRILDGKAKVVGMSCTFPNGDTGLVWRGIFKVGATFECTATVEGIEMGELHSDVAEVTATGVTSAKSVVDDDPYHAKRLTSDGHEELAETGAQLTTLGKAAALTVLLGGLMLAISRRYSRS